MYTPYDEEQLADYNASYYKTNREMCPFVYTLLLVAFSFFFSFYATAIQLFIYMDGLPMNIPLMIAGIFIVLELGMYIQSIFVCWIGLCPCSSWLTCKIRKVWLLVFLIARIPVIICVVIHYLALSTTYSLPISLSILIFSMSNVFVCGFIGIFVIIRRCTK